MCGGQLQKLVLFSLCGSWDQNLGHQIPLSITSLASTFTFSATGMVVYCSHNYILHIPYSLIKTFCLFLHSYVKVTPNSSPKYHILKSYQVFLLEALTSQLLVQGILHTTVYLPPFQRHFIANCTCFACSPLIRFLQK